MGQVVSELGEKTDELEPRQRAAVAIELIRLEMSEMGEAEKADFWSRLTEAVEAVPAEEERTLLREFIERENRG